MVVRNNYFWLDENSEAGFIANGEMLKLNRIVAREHLYGFDFVRARVELIDYPSIGDFETILLINTLHTETSSLPREKMKELFCWLGTSALEFSRVSKENSPKDITIWASQNKIQLELSPD